MWNCHWIHSSLPKHTLGSSHNMPHDSPFFPVLCPALAFYLLQCQLLQLAFVTDFLS